jgi:surfeit locus 1 family protein
MNRKWLFVVFVAVPGLLVLLSLGVWQTKRLAWKEGLLENISYNLSSQPSILPTELKKSEHNYKMVEVEGSLEPRSIFILTPVKGSGAGFRVISPLKLKNGSKILIDRGVIKEQDTDRLETLRQKSLVIGYLFWPNETDYFTPDPNLERNIWFSRDLEKMASFLETQPILVVATENRLDPSLKMQDPTIDIPNNHLQYAITWFMMAILWFGMSAYFVYKMIKKKKIE